MKRIRLGILQTNHDKTVEVGDAFPDDGHRFRDLFDAQEQRFNYRMYMTIGGEVPQDVDEQDAYLITGSPLSVLDHHIFTDDLNRFIRRCDEARKPLIGACFGHQAIAVALGGEVVRAASGYNIGVEESRFKQTKPWMNPAHTALPMYMFHEDQVVTLPPDCELLGSSKNCAITSFSKGDHIFTTQAHPEFSDRFMRALLDYAEAKIPEQNLKQARESIHIKHRGDIFASWCTEFFKGSYS